MTVNDLITASLRRLRVISGADPPSGDDMQDALLRLQDWLDDLRTQDFLGLFETVATWALVPGKVSYECPGDVAAAPFANATEIHGIGYRDAAGIDVMQGPILTNDAWTVIPKKTQPGLPAYWYMRGGPGVITPGYKAFLYPWPVPNVAGLTGLIYYAQPIGAMTLTTVLDGNANLPPGWRRFLRDGLAVELAPEFHVDDPSVLGPLQKSAEEAMRNIKRRKRPLRDLAVPEWFSLNGGGNIYTG